MLGLFKQSAYRNCLGSVAPARFPQSVQYE